MKKSIIILFISIFFLVWITYASYNFIWGTKNSDCWEIDNDIWELQGDYTYQNPDWDSAVIWDVLAELSWSIDTELFWNFYYNNIQFIKKNYSLCNTWVTYSISWSIYSIDNNYNFSEWIWWKMNFDILSSYYCPANWDWLWVLYSDILWYKKVWNISTASWDTVVWDEEWIVWATFNIEEMLKVKWVIWTNNANLVNTWIDVINEEHWERHYSNIIQISTLKSEIIKNINKNISLLTKNITPINKLWTWNYPDGIVDWWTSIKINTLNTDKKVYYFNYDWENAWFKSNEDNQWVILEMSNWSLRYTWPWAFTDYQIPVIWQKTVIVEWANLYINADIYNMTDDSILVIVVKRDPTSVNKQNWWNVYINPDVTNIDAVIIAEGSIINYRDDNDNTTDDVVTDPDLLRAQLYIYGSIFTKNTIWSNKNYYGTDWYIKYWKNSTGWIDKYDLTKLRYFNLIVTTDSNNTSWDCTSTENLLAPRKDDSMETLPYQWAWKRRCFNESWSIDPVQDNLKWLDVFNPVIIEYNPIIQRNPPFILRNK
jgi:hypothetical protein